jgi:hypothetical protein
MPNPLADFDIAPSTPESVDQTFQDLETSAGQLTGAIDASVNAQSRAQAQVTCGDSGCTVTATAQLSIEPGVNTQVTGSRATGRMDATVTVNNLPAGGCTATADLPVPGTQTFSCTDPAAGPVFAAQWALAKAAAEAEAARTGGSVPFQVPYTAEADVYALVTVDVEHEVTDLDDQRRAAARASCSAAGSAAGRTPLCSRLPANHDDCDFTASQLPDHCFEAQVLDLYGSLVTSPDAIAARILEHTDTALGEWRAGRLGFSPDDLAVIRQRPSQANTIMGRILDTRVKELTDADPQLTELRSARNGDDGPGWTNGGRSGASWYDLTTDRDWKGHVVTYAGKLGPGVAIVWR